jgi:glycosyltransferase involved in cell wall biosynthesis
MFSEINSYQWILLCIVLVPLLIQWIYYVGYFSVLFVKPKTVNHDALPCSVIVCAKNEAQNLKELIPLLCKQNHPKHEVIIVNDGSWDESNQLIEEFKLTYSNLKNMYIDPEKKLSSGKKLAITLGIKAAEFEHLVFTDADCRPASENWLSHMSQQFGLFSLPKKERTFELVYPRRNATYCIYVFICR